MIDSDLLSVPFPRNEILLLSVPNPLSYDLRDPKSRLPSSDFDGRPKRLRFLLFALLLLLTLRPDLLGLAAPVRSLRLLV